MDNKIDMIIKAVNECKGGIFSMKSTINSSVEGIITDYHETFNGYSITVSESMKGRRKNTKGKDICGICFGKNKEDLEKFFMISDTDKLHFLENGYCVIEC